MNIYCLLAVSSSVALLISHLLTRLHYGHILSSYRSNLHCRKASVKPGAMLPQYHATFRRLDNYNPTSYIRLFFRYMYLGTFALGPLVDLYVLTVQNRPVCQNTCHGNTAVQSQITVITCIQVGSYSLFVFQSRIYFMMHNTLLLRYRVCMLVYHSMYYHHAV